MLPCDLSLITIHISHWRHFSDFHISQGSVATCLKCGGIFKDNFVANLILSPRVKKVSKSVNIWWSYEREFGVLFFLTHSVERFRRLATEFSTLLRRWSHQPSTAYSAKHRSGVCPSSVCLSHLMISPRRSNDAASVRFVRAVRRPVHSLLSVEVLLHLLRSLRITTP